MKQTAVEFLEEILQSLHIQVTYNGANILSKGIEQAKEMEKEQMKHSYKEGFKYRDTWNWELEVDWEIDSNEGNEQEFEQYYNETFKSE